MRFRMRHELSYRFSSPARNVIHAYRLNPRNHDNQHMVEWRMDVDADCRTKFSEDGFGNFVQSFEIDGPIPAVAVTVDFTIETEDSAGILRGAVERFPTPLYLRDTPLTGASPETAALFADVARAHDEPLPRLHALVAALRETVKWDKAARVHEPAALRPAGEVIAAGSGGSFDIAHVFVACARHGGIPARFVSGYCLPGDGEDDPLTAEHFWAEAHVEGYGWIGFDAAVGFCPTDAHIRAACGLDWLSAAPARTAFTGVGREEVDVKIEMTQLS